MKKLLVVLLILAFTVTPVKSADLLEDFSGYQRLLKTMLGTSPEVTTYISDTTANDIVRIAATMMLASFKMSQAIVYDTTVFKKTVYAIDTSIYGIAAIQFISGDSTVNLDYVPMADWNKAYATKFPDTDAPISERTTRRRPFFYDYISDSLLLFPTPISSGDSLRIIGWKKVESISASDNLSTIPVEYRPAVFFYSLYLIAKKEKRRDSQEFRQMFRDALSFLGNDAQSQGVPNE